MLEIRDLHVRFHNRDREAALWENPAPANPSLP